MVQDKTTKSRIDLFDKELKLYRTQEVKQKLLYKLEQYIEYCYRNIEDENIAVVNIILKEKIYPTMFYFYLTIYSIEEYKDIFAKVDAISKLVNAFYETKHTW